MPTPRPFNLTYAVSRWRQSLAGSSALDADAVLELESHLRDLIAALMSAGLSEEEAFIVAAKRIGTFEALQEEFAKLNPSAIWIHRATWMLAGIFLFQIIRSLSDGIAFVTGVVVRHLIPIHSIQEAVDSCTLVGVGGALAMVAIWMMLRRPSVVTRGLERILSHPFIAGAAIYVALLAATSLESHLASMRMWGNAGAVRVASPFLVVDFAQRFLDRVMIGVRPFGTGPLIALALQFTPQLLLALVLVILGRRKLGRTAAASDAAFLARFD